MDKILLLIFDLFVSKTLVFYPCLYAEDAWKMLLDAAGAIVPDRDLEVLNSLTKFVDQLPSVVNQVILQFSEISICYTTFTWRSNDITLDNLGIH